MLCKKRIAALYKERNSPPHILRDNLLEALDIVNEMIQKLEPESIVVAKDELFPDIPIIYYEAGRQDIEATAYVLAFELSRHGAVHLNWESASLFPYIIYLENGKVCTARLNKNGQSIDKSILMQHVRKNVGKMRRVAQNKNRGNE